MVRSVDYTLILLSIEEVAMCAGHKVLVEIDDNCALIVGNTGWNYS
jgi:hypothetical protein